MPLPAAEFHAIGVEMISIISEQIKPNCRYGGRQYCLTIVAK